MIWNFFLPFSPTLYKVLEIKQANKSDHPFSWSQTKVTLLAPTTFQLFKSHHEPVLNPYPTINQSKHKTYPPEISASPAAAWSECNRGE